MVVGEKVVALAVALAADLEEAVKDSEEGAMVVV